MHISKSEIESLERRKRANLINAISGIKAANLIGTQSASGLTNVAVFNSVFHLGANPALQGFIMRPVGEVPRHTYENIVESGYYTINHISTDLVEKAHYTSAKLGRSDSEFRACGLTEEYIGTFKAPFVKECHLKMGLSLVEEIPIKANGTILIIGQVEELVVTEDAIDDEGHINLTNAKTAGISGLNSYYSLNHIATLPYAKPENIPDFGS